MEISCTSILTFKSAPISSIKIELELVPGDSIAPATTAELSKDANQFLSKSEPPLVSTLITHITVFMIRESQYSKINLSQKFKENFEI